MVWSIYERAVSVAPLFTDKDVCQCAFIDITAFPDMGKGE